MIAKRASVSRTTARERQRNVRSCFSRFRVGFCTAWEIVDHGSRGDNETVLEMNFATVVSRECVLDGISGKKFEAIRVVRTTTTTTTRECVER